jgi:hypothetical protein
MVMAGGVFAQTSLLDNFERQSDQNLFGGYWYFYDDNAEESNIGNVNGKGTSVVHSAKKEGDRLLFDPSVSLNTINVNRGNYSALLDFTFGETFQTGYDNRSPEQARDPSFASCEEAQLASTDWTTGCYPFGMFVGIGTTLSPFENRTIDLSGAASVRFWARASEALSVRFFVEQEDIKKDGAFYGRILNITTSWASYIVHMTADTAGGGMMQPGWTAPSEQDLQMPLNLSVATRIAWQIQAGPSGGWISEADIPNAVGERYQFYLNDIEVLGYNFVPHDMCMSCVGKDRIENGSKPFSDFIAPDLPHSPSGDAVNVLNWYWYAYDDNNVQGLGGVTGNSNIIGDVDVGGIDCDNEYLMEGQCALIVVEDNDGGNFVGIQFEMGRSLQLNDPDVGVVTMNPFVGIGTNLYADTATVAANLNFFNAESEGVEGLYFEYRTFGVSALTFEVQDQYDVPEAGQPLGSPTVRPETAIWYINLPGNAEGNADWQKATVPFRVLTTHTEWDGVRAWSTQNPTLAALQKNALAKFQFKIEGTENDVGGFYIRNAYFLDATGSKIARVATGNRTAPGLRATYNRGVVAVNWNAASTVASGKVSLVNTRGRVISSAPIANISGNRITANLGSGTIPTGMYFVRIDARDMNGKRVTQQIPMSIVK